MSSNTFSQISSVFIIIKNSIKSKSSNSIRLEKVKHKQMVKYFIVFQFGNCEMKINGVFFLLFQFKVKGYKSVVAGQRLRIMSNIMAITNNGFSFFKHHFYHLEQIIWPVSSFQENT